MGGRQKLPGFSDQWDRKIVWSKISRYDKVENLGSHSVQKGAEKLVCSWRTFGTTIITIVSRVG